MTRRPWIAALCLFVPLLARAEPPREQWFTVLLDGRKIGSFEATRIVAGDEVRTRQALSIELERAGIHVALSSSESATETVRGEPRAFESVSKLSGSESRVEGHVHGASADVATTAAGVTTRRTIAWPSGAVLPEGLRLAGIKAGLAPGSRATALAFQPSSVEAASVESVIGALESIDLPGGARRLHRVDQTLAIGGFPMRTRAWIDEEQTVYKLTLPMMGVELVLLACDRACATAPSQGSDVFEHTLMASPRALTAAELGGTMRYTIAATAAGSALNIPETDEQGVEARGDARIVTVHRDARARGNAPPLAQDSRPNDWLQSTAPEIVALSKTAAADATTPLERMRRIEAFVRTYIRTKSLDVGYASALEVARKPEGDCTEHAVLVAALGRALDIPTRVVDGLAYAPQFAGKDRIFVPHAWAQAWIDGRWRSFDAALDGFDSGHIALAVGDGDPWRFYSGLDLLGRISLRSVDAAPR